MEIGTILVFVIVFLIVFVLAVLGVLRLIANSKGKITINPEKIEYGRGEKITGTVTLNLKKPLEAGKLNIGLVGERKTKTYSSRGSSYKKEIIFDFSKPINKEGQYPPGESTYKFDLLIPKDVAPEKSGNAIVDTMIKTVQVVTGSGSVSWFLKSNLELKGFDIKRKLRINIA